MQKSLIEQKHTLRQKQCHLQMAFLFRVDCHSAELVNGLIEQI